MKKHHWLLAGKILCFGFACLAGKSWAVDYILNTPGSTVTNGSGTTYVSGDTSNKPDISSGLADGDTITLTTASGGNNSEHSIQITGDNISGINGNGVGMIVTYGNNGVGNNTIELQTGSSVQCVGIANTSCVYGVRVYGETTGSNIGVVGGAGNEDNKIISQGDISVETGCAYGIYGLKNNIIQVDGNISSTSIGISVWKNNELNISGSIHSTKTAIAGASNNIFNISGDISVSGANSYGIGNWDYIEKSEVASTGSGCESSKNNISLSGNISVSGDNSSGIHASNSTLIINDTGLITAQGNNSEGIDFTGNAHLSGKIYASNGASAITTSDLTLYLLNGVSITGEITNKSTTNTSYFISGYATDAVTGKADKTTIDGTYSFTFDNNISSVSNHGLWDGFIAGGTTVLNGDSNQLCRIFVGADSFDSTTVDDGYDGAGNSQTYDLNSIAGAIATLTVNQNVSSTNDSSFSANVTIGAGSTYNLNGTHIHEFDNVDSFNVLGTMNLGNGASIVDYQEDDSVSIVLGGKANNGTGATVGGTLASNAADQSLGIKVYTGSTSNVNVGAGKLTLSSVANNGTLNSTVANGAELSLRTDASLNNLDLTGTLRVGATQTLASLRTTNSTTGNVIAETGAFTLNGLTNNGAINFEIGKAASLANGTGSTIDLSGSKGTLALDFGDEADTAVYAKASGEFKSAGDSTAGNKIESIYGVNGVAGTTYAEVFDAALTDMNDVAFTDGAILNSEDRYRKYTLINNAGNNPFDIMVENNNMMRATIEGMGGDATAAEAADFLVENEGLFSPSGQAFVQKFTALQGNDLLTASRQLAGEDATTGVLQAGLHTIADAAGSVRNQMTSMRMGNISAGMASSFSSSGATAALEDISDADKLSAAYDAGYTAASEPTAYKQVEVWATGFGGFGEQGSVGSMTGWDFWNAGTMVGLDYTIGRELRIGGLLGYSYNKTNSYDSLSESIDNALRFGAYASYNYDNFFVDISPTMGIHILESKRNLVTNNLVAKGERTALDFNINGTIGYNFTLPAEVVVTPSFSLGYTNYHDPEYTETGGGAGNLTIDSFGSNSLLQDMSVKVGKLFRCSDKLAFLPEVWGGWEVEYLNTGGYRNSTTSTDIGSQSYSSAMNGMATNRGYFGLGLTSLIGDNVSVFGRYDHRLWSKGFNVGFSAGVKVSF